MTEEVSVSGGAKCAANDQGRHRMVTYIRDQVKLYHEVTSSK